MKVAAFWTGMTAIAGCALALTATPAIPGTAAVISRACPVDSVAVIESRFHIKCAPVPGVGHTQAIRYFALPLSEPEAKITAITALAIEAKRAKKPMTLWFDMEDYKSVPGCQGSDCRRLVGARLIAWR